MIVDTFLYNGERDLLDLRMCELESQVDLFVAVEATQTFTGLNRTIEPLRLPQLRHFIVDDLPYAKPRNAWKREVHQRNRILQAISDLPDDTIVLVSDVDELPKLPEWLRVTAESLEFGEVYVCWQDWYQFSFNTKVIGENSTWRGTRVCRLGTLKKLYPQAIRNQHTAVLKDAGWHFSWMGGANMMRAKLEAYSHQYNLGQMEGTLNSRIASYWNHQYQYIEGVTHLPKCVRDNYSKYEKYFVYPEAVTV